MDIEALKEKARKIRIDTINLSVDHSNGHIASAISYIELLVYIYEVLLGNEDQFILSKGHGVLSLYAILQDKGFNPTISGHPDIEVNEGIVCTTGSLGHGLAIGAGKAFAKKLQNKSGKIYVVIGDGECQEGSVWETVNLIRKFKLSNIIIILDKNKYQALSTTEEILDDNNFKEKFEAFGMKVNEINGHSFEEIEKAFNDSSQVIIANTIKGKGISFMENVPCWHSRMLNNEELNTALADLNGTIN